MKRRLVFERPTIKEIVMQGLRVCRRNISGIILFLAFSFGILCSLSLSGCGKPMYVATLGADVYHTPACKYAEQSLDKYGKIKRLNYYTDLHKDLSGRTPCPKCKP